MHFDQSLLSYIFVIPFIGMLLSIALGPILFPTFWEHNTLRISLGWASSIIILLFLRFGLSETSHQLGHMLAHEYIPFILMIGALFTITGGIHIVIRGKAGPIENTSVLLIGSILASLIGTTGAAMLLIRPLIELNRYRIHKTHTIIFFIFTVANIGGSLTPLGDPPLFLGYLKGVPFEWPFLNLLAPLVVALVPLLGIFFVIDKYYLFKDTRHPDHKKAPLRKDGEARFSITGGVNIFFLFCTIMIVWLSGLSEQLSGGNSPTVILGITWSQIFRDLGLLVLIGLSLTFTPGNVRHYNHFTWAPFKEVAEVFIGIFVTLIPIIAMLHQHNGSPFSDLIHLANPNGTPNNTIYFWITGSLSAFLDNAPTYLVFFNMAEGIATGLGSGDPTQLLISMMGQTLVAISVGAVFMGAISYIGNAPNFMVRSIAEKKDIQMPSFFGYMAWSLSILIPLFVLVNWIFFK